MNPMPSLNPQPAPRPNAPGVRSNRPPSIPRLPLEEPVRVDLDEFGLPLEVSAEHPAPVKAAEPAASPAVSADTTAIAEPAPGAEIAEFEEIGRASCRERVSSVV